MQLQTTKPACVNIWTNLCTQSCTEAFEYSRIFGLRTFHHCFRANGILYCARLIPTGYRTGRYHLHLHLAAFQFSTRVGQLPFLADAHYSMHHILRRRPINFGSPTLPAVRHPLLLGAANSQHPSPVCPILRKISRRNAQPDCQHGLDAKVPPSGHLPYPGPSSFILVNERAYPLEPARHQNLCCVFLKRTKLVLALSISRFLLIRLYFRQNKYAVNHSHMLSLLFLLIIWPATQGKKIPSPFFAKQNGPFRKPMHEETKPKSIARREHFKNTVFQATLRNRRLCQGLS